MKSAEETLTNDSEFCSTSSLIKDNIVNLLKIHVSADQLKYNNKIYKQ